MAFVSKREVIQKIIEGLRLDPGKDSIPNEILDKIMPTFNVNEVPEINVVRSSLVTTTGQAVSMFTTPTDKNFFLTSVILNAITDSTLDASGIVTVTATINGVQRTIASLASLSGTGLESSFPVGNSGVTTQGIKLDRATAIVLTNTTFAAGQARATATIMGYTMES